ncbi:MAG: hypothetical protein E6J42_06190 [Chloroflexi bacterium]|nr:MAG: hypothetical protein E6J42_06190 [Chloroflexota bacterium]
MALAGLVLVAALLASDARQTHGAITVVAGAGDITDTGNQGVATANLINNLNPDGVITLGDNQYQDGCLSSFQSRSGYSGSWGAFKSKTRPAIGNHDSHTTSCSTAANGYFDYFNGVGSGTCDYTCRAGKRGEGWYSYDLGDWHFIVLNSECNGTAYDFCDHTAQLDWLTNDLAANTKFCTLAYWHRPIVAPSSVHTDDEGHFADPYMGGDNVWQKLYDGGVDLVLQGHDHLFASYDRYNRAGNDADPNGIRHFIVGTGGVGLYAVSETKPGQNATDDADLGILKLTLNPASYSCEFVPVDGSYSGTGSPTGSDSCRMGSARDSDGDTWSDVAEGIIGTDPHAACGVNAWPPDINNDRFVDIGDISHLTGDFGDSVPPGPARYNIAPDPPDRFIDVIGDISRMTGLFGKRCS